MGNLADITNDLNDYWNDLETDYWNSLEKIKEDFRYNKNKKL